MTDKQPKKFATELTDYAARRGTEGPYADDLDVDVLIVGAGFGKTFPHAPEKNKQDQKRPG